MDRERIRTAGPTTLVALGGALFGTALVYHLWVERLALDALGGPILALAVDGLLALALAYAGSLLATEGFGPTDEWRVVAWTLGGGVLFMLSLSATVVIRLAEGRTVPEPGFVALVAVEVGALAGFVAGFYNVRARRDARRSRRARQALGFVNRTLRHDLGNQLTVVRGRADVIGEAAGSGDPERIREWADDVTETVDQSEALIDGTGAMAEALLGVADRESVDLAAVAADVCERADERYDAAIERDLPDSAPVRGNESLQSVVSNLVENAVEHGPAGDDARARQDVATRRVASAPSGAQGDGVQNDSEGSQIPAERGRVDDLTVEVSASVENDGVVLRVADDGVGIPDEAKASLFEPRPGEDHGGGLHLVATLVERFGGSVDVRDNDPRGAVFVVELPRAD